MEQNNEIQYLIPTNVTSKFEFFVGYGLSELLKTAIVAAIGVVLYLILFFIPFQIRLFGLIIGPTALTFFIVKRDATGGSILSMLLSMRKYFKSQHRYLYKI